MRTLIKSRNSKKLFILQYCQTSTLWRKAYIVCILFIHVSWINAQACNCTYNFGAGPSSSSLWSSSGVGGSGYVVNKTICVQGELIIDIDARFLDCDFIMHPGSSIYVSNLTLFKATNTEFKRCGLFNQMWNGITTTWGSELDFNKNTISDAITGILCDPNTTISQFIQNKFNRCYIGLEADQTIVERPFVGNRFYSEGTLLAPHTGFPIIGMRLRNTLSLVSERSGFYEHMRWGIVLNETTYIGENITMQNGPATIPPPMNGVITNPGIGILSSRSNFTINNSTFRRIPFGIWSDGGSSSTITNSNFFNLAFGVLVQDNPRRPIVIQDNIFDTIRTSGISVKDCAPHTQTTISDNSINFTENSIYGQPTVYCMGITIDNAGDIIEAGSEIQILDNQVFQNTDEPPNFFGYFFYNTWSILAQNNTVDFISPYDDNAWGIYVNNCSQVNLNANTITGGGNDHPASTGIYLNLTHFSNLCCNTTEGVNIGTEFDAVCLETRLRGSNFEGPYTTNAMLFNFTITAIQQEYPGNNWIGVAPVDARYVGDHITAEEDRFIVSTPGLPFHPDDPIDGPQFWFFRPMNPDPESTCFQDENCDGIPETSCDDFPNDSLLLLNGYGGLHSEGLTWQARKTVLRKFWEDPDFGCNASLSTNFKSSHQNSNLGLLAQIANDVSEALKISEPVSLHFDTLSSIIQAESEEIISIDAWWEDEEANLEYWKLQRDIHVQNLIDANVEYDSILTLIQTQVELAIPSIQADLNEITAQNIMEENEVYVSKIFLEKMLNPEYTLDSTQRDTLTSIAAQCPLDGGGAVVRARALLWSPELENLHPGGSCSGIYGLRINHKNNETLEIDVIPNPNNGKFELQIIEKEKEGLYNIRIFDTKGKLWRSMETTDQKIEMDMSREPGLYFLNITKADGTKYTKKICVF